MDHNKTESLQVLQDIKQIMDRSSRLLSLSGWSGIWAGLMGLGAAAMGFHYLSDFKKLAFKKPIERFLAELNLVEHFVVLAIITFILALGGAFLFSYRKNKREGQSTFNKAAKRMMISMLIPLGAGAWMIAIVLRAGQYEYIAPLSLIFYGMTLINSSKYTTPEIRWLGLSEIILGCIATLYPDLGLYFWAFGFGLLHLVYGIIMWNKYDRFSDEKRN